MSRPQIDARFHSPMQLRFRDDLMLTRFAGLKVLHALFAILAFNRRLRHALRPCKSGRYRLWRIIKLLIVMIMLGGHRLRHFESMQRDPMLCRIIGVRQLPSVSTLSRYLSKAPQASPTALRALNRQIIEDRLRSLHPKELTIDFDGSVQSTRARAEGVAVGFNKKKRGAYSYYPLYATLPITGQFYDLLHRPGNAHDSRGAAAFALECFERLGQVCPRSTLSARFDAAHFNLPTLVGLQEAGVKFTCSVPWRRYLEIKIHAQDSEGWISSPDYPFEYKIVEFVPDKWSKIADAAPICERWRTIVVRYLRDKPLKGPLQLELFEPVSREYEYNAIVTNRGGRADHVVFFHRGRGSQEKILGEAKQDAALGVVMGRRRVANELFTLCGMMAHNLGREWQLRTDRKTRNQGKNQGSVRRFESLGRLSRRFLQQAGRIIKPQGRLVLEMNTDEGTQRRIERDLDRLQATY